MLVTLFCYLALGTSYTTVASTGLFRSFFISFLLFSSAASLHTIGRVLDGIEWDELVFFEFGRLGAYAEFFIWWITILRWWGWRMEYVDGGGMKFNQRREGTNRRIPLDLEGE